MCHIKFKNTLPEPPVDFKLIKVQPELSRYVPYMPTDLERDYKYEVPANLTKSALMDMVDLNTLKPQLSTGLPVDQFGNFLDEMLQAEDEPLLVSFEVLERKRKAAADQQQRQQQQQTEPSPMSLDSRRPEVTWLRRTEYISSEAVKARGRTEPAANVTHEHHHTEINDQEDLIRVVEAGFKPVQLDHLQHPVNKTAHALEVIPILPTMNPALPASFSQCLFDTDPKATHGLGDVELEPGSEKSSILRAMSNPNDPSESFVWYYLKASQDPSYVYVRDYDIQRNDKIAQSYALLLDEDSLTAQYVPVTMQFHLRKRRVKASETPRQPHGIKVTRQKQDH